MAITIHMQDLLESGAHFGHQRRRWNPKMKKFIFEQRNGTNIIDLQQTVEALKRAHAFVKEQIAQGKIILYVGTKKQAKESIENFAKEVGMPYINHRWLGGLLTNFRTVEKSIQKMKELEMERDTGFWNRIPKKEALLKARKLEKLEKNLGGIRNMTRLPDLIYIVDVVYEDIAVKEARRKKIPIVAIVDTNADPDLIDYAIPANDDAIKSIRYITSVITDAVKEGLAEYQGSMDEAKEAEGETAEASEDRLPQELEEKIEEEAEQYEEKYKEADEF